MKNKSFYFVFVHEFFLFLSGTMIRLNSQTKANNLGLKKFWSGEKVFIYFSHMTFALQRIKNTKSQELGLNESNSEKETAKRKNASWWMWSTSNSKESHWELHQLHNLPKRGKPAACSYNNHLKNLSNGTIQIWALQHLNTLSVAAFKHFECCTLQRCKRRCIIFYFFPGVWNFWLISKDIFFQIGQMHK